MEDAGDARARRDIAVVGAGYVGLTVGVCLARLGHKVRMLEKDATRVASLRAGVSPIFEAGMEEMLAIHSAAGDISFTTDVTEAIAPSSFVFLCVPTPSTEDGSPDTSYLREASSEIGPLLPAGAIVINKSTVPVGSTEIVRDALNRDDVDVVSNPEFLREGSAIADFLNPDRIIIGAADAAVAEAVAALYGSLDAEVVITDPASAELVKYASNAYLATRLSFINAVAEVCEVLGADVNDVARGIGLDHRIGTHFLQPGPGWGGSCFPKDTSALALMAEAGGFEFRFLRAVIDSNATQFDRIASKAQEMLRNPTAAAPAASNPIVAVWGLAFKAGTDDIRNSPAIEIINRLTEQGITVIAYDPQATGEISGITRARTAIDAVRDASLLLVLTEWPEFAAQNPAAVATAMRIPQVLDTRSVLPLEDWTRAGVYARALGQPAP